LTKWCVEFGAWDGIHLSNTYNLIKNSDYKAVLIEGDPEKYKELCANIPREDVVKNCEFVEFDGDRTLDKILARSPIPADFDLLSIDIDGCDYFIFESLQDYRPRIVCVEYNPSIPNAVSFVQEKNFSVKHGASARALVELACGKGYKLVALTTTNLFFVADEYAKAVVGEQNFSLDDLRDDSGNRHFIFVGYDGTILSDRNDFMLPWHDVPISSEDLQVLPKFLRRYKLDYSPLQKSLFLLWLLAKKPRLALAQAKTLFART
jgi:hypothetical protein